jgi:hypothetical protein
MKYTFVEYPIPAIYRDEVSPEIRAIAGPVPPKLTIVWWAASDYRDEAGFSCYSDSNYVPGLSTCGNGAYYVKRHD